MNAMARDASNQNAEKQPCPARQGSDRSPGARDCIFGDALANFSEMKKTDGLLLASADRQGVEAEAAFLWEVAAVMSYTQPLREQPNAVRLIVRRHIAAFLDYYFGAK